METTPRFLPEQGTVIFLQRQERSNAEINLYRLNFFYTIYMNLVRTSQETYYVSATKHNRLMLFREIIAANHTEHINTPCGQNAGFQCVKAGGIYSNHCALKGQICVVLPLNAAHTPSRIVFVSITSIYTSVS
jgi:hypothetical protein